MVFFTGGQPDRFGCVQSEKIFLIKQATEHVRLSPRVMGFSSPAMQPYTNRNIYVPFHHVLNVYFHFTVVIIDLASNDKDLLKKLSSTTSCYEKIKQFPIKNTYPIKIPIVKLNRGKNNSYHLFACLFMFIKYFGLDNNFNNQKFYCTL